MARRKLFRIWAPRVGVVYAALRAAVGLKECVALHEPVEGWVWVRCPDVGALLRDCARVVSRGGDPSPLVTAGGQLVDVLELDRVDLSGVLRGEVEVACLEGHPLAALGKLVELRASRVLYREGRLVADVTGLHVEALVSRGLIPAVWRRLPRPAALTPGR
ncbi:MAG: hypothetical protein QXI55_07060 [Thermofilum sp.]